MNRLQHLYFGLRWAQVPAYAEYHQCNLSKILNGMFLFENRAGNTSNLYTLLNGFGFHLLCFEKHLINFGWGIPCGQITLHVSFVQRAIAPAGRLNLRSTGPHFVIGPLLNVGCGLVFTSSVVLAFVVVVGGGGEGVVAMTSGLVCTPGAPAVVTGAWLQKMLVFAFKFHFLLAHFKVVG